MKQKHKSTKTINNKKQDDKTWLTIAVVVAGIFALCGICFGIYGLVQNLPNSSSSQSSSLLNNTTWRASDESEVVFSDNKIDWYRYPDDRLNSYYSGTYTFYMGEAAVEHLLNDMSEYGITDEKLQSLFKRNDEYSKDNFVVVDIKYDKLIVNHNEQSISKPEAPWYGFILNDNTYLDVANMVTGTYYKFTKV